jgi:hypothetical protein
MQCTGRPVTRAYYVVSHTYACISVRFSVHSVPFASFDSLSLVWSRATDFTTDARKKNTAEERERRVSHAVL